MAEGPPACGGGFLPRPPTARGTLPVTLSLNRCTACSEEWGHVHLHVGTFPCCHVHVAMFRYIMAPCWWSERRACKCSCGTATDDSAKRWREIRICLAAGTGADTDADTDTVPAIATRG
eukprot:Tamp_14917.p2 GENE.Tamp_14917~~Tamp_14917.p2  ORF type:complete len:119 (+),score=6.31 Tamp_14917:206-562(+)